MDTIHDLGGREGFGPVRWQSDDDKTPFHEPWQARTWAICMMMMGRLQQDQTGWTLDWYRHVLERIAPADYLSMNYFDKWSQAMMATLVDDGVGEIEEFAEGHNEHADEAVHVMLDVTRWLPEIAADSDLPEEEWNIVNADAESLGDIFDEVHHAIHDDQKIDYPKIAARVPQIIQRLQAMVDEGTWNTDITAPRLDEDTDVANKDVADADVDGESE